MFTKRKEPGVGEGSEILQSQANTDAMGGVSRTTSRPDATAFIDRPPSARQSETAAPVRRPVEKRPDPESRQLTVGRGIKLRGEITACERLVVEGEVEAELNGAQVLEIAKDGLFRGVASVDRALINGTFEGELTVQENLQLRSTGRIEGALIYAEMEVERGGRIRGEIEELSSLGKLPLKGSRAPENKEAISGAAPQGGQAASAEKTASSDA